MDYIKNILTFHVYEPVTNGHRLGNPWLFIWYIDYKDSEILKGKKSIQLGWVRKVRRSLVF